MRRYSTKRSSHNKNIPNLHNRSSNQLQNHPNIQYTHLHNRRRHSRCNNSTRCNFRTANHNNSSTSSTPTNNNNNNNNKLSSNVSLSHKTVYQHLRMMMINSHRRWGRLGIWCLWVIRRWKWLVRRTLCREGWWWRIVMLMRRNSRDY